MKHTLVIPIFCLTALGCWQTVEYPDVAAICLQQQSESESLVLFAGGRATGPCERNGAYTCDIEQNGDTLLVQTTYSVEEGGWLCHGPDMALVDGMTPCVTLDPLDAGTYTVDYAGRTESITVPNADIDCAGFPSD
jgi:hypothetical protein